MPPRVTFFSLERRKRGTLPVALLSVSSPVARHCRARPFGRRMSRARRPIHFVLLFVSASLSFSCSEKLRRETKRRADRTRLIGLSWSPYVHVACWARTRSNLDDPPVRDRQGPILFARFRRSARQLCVIDYGRACDGYDERWGSFDRAKLSLNSEPI